MKKIIGTLIVGLLLSLSVINISAKDVSVSNEKTFVGKQNKMMKRHHRHWRHHRHHRRHHKM